MYCKQCNTPLEKGTKVCPGCGRKVTPLWKLIAAITACVLLLAVLVLVVLNSLGIKIQFIKAKRPNDIFYKDTYTVSAEKAAQSADTVVATVANRELTNGELQIYYWTQVYDYLNYYGNYYFDPAQPLEGQIMDSKTGETWQQFFIEIALTTWKRYEMLSLMAEKDDHQLAADLQSYMDTLELTLTEAAEEGDYATVDEMLQHDMGPGCFYRHYAGYMADYCMGLDYFEYLYDSLLPTDAEIEEYFTENEAMLKNSNITKESGLSSSVYHILLEPEGGVTGEDNVTTYTDEAWAACLKEAEALLQQWKQGEATAESFSALAKTHSEDPGVVTNAGFYEDITPTASYVEPFRTWAVDATRKPGDTGIVKTQFGYHIMYFVEGEEMWISACRENLISQRASDKIDEFSDANKMNVNYKKICIGDALALAG